MVCGSALQCPVCHWNGRRKILALNCCADFEEYIVKRVVYFSQDQDLKGLSCVKTEFALKVLN